MPTPLERAFPAATSIGRGGMVATPFQYVLTGEDNLRVTVINSVANVIVKIRGRMLVQETDAVQAIALDVVPVATGGETVRELPLGAGVLLNLHARASQQSVQRGQMFVQIEIIRGAGTAAETLATLLSGYVGSWGGRAWPGSALEAPDEGPGVIRTIAGALGSGVMGAAIDVPIYTRWKILSAFTSLTTDATPGTRRVLFVAEQQGLIVVESQTSIDQAPTTGANHCWMPACPQPLNSGVVFGQGGLPTELFLTNLNFGVPSRVYGFTAGGAAGDSWTPMQLLVEEWRHPAFPH